MVNDFALERKGEKDVSAIGVKTLTFNRRLTQKLFFEDYLFFPNSLSYLCASLSENTQILIQ